MRKPKNGQVRLLALAAAMVGLSVVQASAYSPMQISRSATSQPIGHFEYCQANPDECSIRTRNPKILKMTDALWRRLVAVNTRINTEVKPVEDIDLYGKDEHWTLPTNGQGDCEDYVLAKQLELRNAGIPVSTLLITILRRENGQGHAVLTVRTDKGDFILDNLNDKVVEWHETPYTFLKVQSARHSGRWVAITNGDTPAVAAVPKR